MSRFVAINLYRHFKNLSKVKLFRTHIRFQNIKTKTADQPIG